MEKRKYTVSLNASKMAKRIHDREGNIYDKRVIENILDMYMDECYKALLAGERVHISNVGTIIPEVKTCISFNLPVCNKENGNPPYTKLRISRNVHMGEDMNRVLMRNIKNGIYGLEKLPFGKQQLDLLKDGGFIPEDVDIAEIQFPVEKEDAEEE